MAINNLASTLEKEGITSNQLATRAYLNKSTVKSIALKKRTGAPGTQLALVNALNRLTKKTFAVEEIFPV